MKKRVYLDNVFTPIDTRALQEMINYYGKEFMNPSSIHREGVHAKKALEEARKGVASYLHAHSDEIIFTSGGTESNGLALEGAGRAARRGGIAKPHLIVSSIEHSSVMKVAEMMERHGVEVTRLPVDSSGVVSLSELKKSLKPSTYLVSIISVNNETGAIQPVREVAKIIRHFRKTHTSRHNPDTYPLFHTDAALALYEDVNVERLGVDLLTLDGSKVYGPRGIGALYVRRNSPIEQIIYGGGQERGLRSGTENVPAIAGFAKALEIAEKKKEKESARMTELRTYFTKGLKSIRGGITVNGEGSPQIVNVTIPDIDNEFFILQLDAKGVSSSTKSSCLRDEDESYVLKAMGKDSRTSVRFALGRETTMKDLDYVLKTIDRILSSR
ncbi:MAG: cysteine desulfurase family protein [Candidatus Taylorbacteria bacterium]